MTLIVSHCCIQLEVEESDVSILILYIFRAIVLYPQFVSK
jgi:hypothetical protein